MQKSVFIYAYIFIIISAPSASRVRGLSVFVMQIKSDAYVAVLLKLKFSYRDLASRPDRDEKKKNPATRY